MVRVRIQKIIWKERIPEHIAKHNVSIDQAEAIILSDAFEMEGHTGKKILVNRVGSRILSVIVLMVGNKLTIVTARDADKAEREEFYEFEKKKLEKIA